MFLVDIREAARRAVIYTEGMEYGPGAMGPGRVFMVPYQRNPYFTGREDVLDALYEALRSGGSAALSQAEPVAALPEGTRTAISGLGGIGKTQPAVEYAYRHAGEYRAVAGTSLGAPASLPAGGRSPPFQDA